MALGNDAVKRSVSSLTIETLESRSSGELFSPEEVVWADSCLVKDPQISDSNWDEMTDALLEILSSQTEAPECSRATESSPGGVDILMPSHRDVEETMECSGRGVTDFVSANYEAESISMTNAGEDMVGTSSSTAFVGNPFLPTYNENFREADNSDFENSENELSTEDIFKVWDLNIPSVEDELLKQLDEALTERPVQMVPSSFDDSGAEKGFKEDSLEDLIASIADLSLDQNIKNGSHPSV